MILFAGDCHGDFVPVIEEAGEASAVVLLGDQEPLNDLVVELGPGVAQKTWWIYGNHDSDYLDYMTHHESMAERNLHCQVVEVEGVRIAGLGGVFRAKKFEVDQTTRLAEVDLNCPHDYREAWIKLRRGGRAYPADFTSIFPDDLKSLLALAGHVDVLVTHEAPESHPLGFQLIGDIARAMGVRMLIHGHHHERYNATIAGGIRVEGIGMARTAEGFFWLGQGLGERA
ncbi:MAG: metallophosphoesterase [Proteobacteria bacterium]|jgi:predicted phosphodiesterase|nr:metallophosphoesterase [Pseudomonadota bacterium]